MQDHHSLVALSMTNIDELVSMMLHSDEHRLFYANRLYSELKTAKEFSDDDYRRTMNNFQATDLLHSLILAWGIEEQIYKGTWNPLNNKYVYPDNNYTDRWRQFVYVSTAFLKLLAEWIPSNMVAGVRFVKERYFPLVSSLSDEACLVEEEAVESFFRLVQQYYFSPSTVACFWDYVSDSDLEKILYSFGNARKLWGNKPETKQAKYPMIQLFHEVYDGLHFDNEWHSNVAGRIFREIFDDVWARISTEFNTLRYGYMETIRARLHGVKSSKHEAKMLLSLELLLKDIKKAQTNRNAKPVTYKDVDRVFLELGFDVDDGSDGYQPKSDGYKPQSGHNEPEATAQMKAEKMVTFSTKPGVMTQEENDDPDAEPETKSDYSKLGVLTQDETYDSDDEPQMKPEYPKPEVMGYEEQTDDSDDEHEMKPEYPKPEVMGYEEQTDDSDDEPEVKSENANPNANQARVQDSFGREAGNNGISVHSRSAFHKVCGNGSITSPIQYVEESHDATEGGIAELLSNPIRKRQRREYCVDV